LNKKNLLIPIMAIILILFTFYILTTPDNKPSESEVVWSKTFGGNNNEEGYYVLSTDDNGCITLGYTQSYSNNLSDIYLVKIDKDGNKEWEKNYGGSKEDYGKSLIQTDDGYIIAGTSDSTSEDYNAWLIKIDSNGNMIWNKTQGGIREDKANSITETSDGGYIVTGSTYSYGAKSADLWVFKINNTGSLVWTKIYGGEEYDEGRSIAETDEGYVIAGETESYPKDTDNSNAWLLKIDKTGKHIWNKTFDGFGYNDLFNHIINTDDGFIAVGHARNKDENGIYDEYSIGYIVLTDENGELISERTLDDNEETGISSVAEADDGYIVTGYIGPYGTGEGDITVEKIDTLGNRVWLKKYGGNYSDSGVWIDRGTGSNYFVTGYQEVGGTGFIDLWLLKLNAEAVEQ